ncbi:MAG: arginine--tRNA ligase, partial [Actinomycetota bacterium]|nr:arginine--tRNA ligase [Actinomycetota bacterium]
MPGRPKRAEQGDYSSNAAMLLAPMLEKSPREVAQFLADDLGNDALSDSTERIEVAGPGFLNFFMTDAWYREAVSALLHGGGLEQPGREGPDVLLEFVSANPTGPLTAAGGRGAAYGDALARILEAAGRSVKREYFLNDAGAQIRNFAASIAARMQGEELPPDGYAGDYVRVLADELADQGLEPSDHEELARCGTEAMRKRIEATLERFGVQFDTWSSERALHDRGALAATLEELRVAGHTYEADDALWLKTSAFGDDKDRVLIRSDGEPTYFAADVAYHRDKLVRGAGLMIDPLGADHHGYVPRMKAAVAMLTGDSERYEAPIMQLVNIVDRGERTRMSKRAGDFVTLDELIDDIGADAARFFLLQRSHDTVIDLDIELARSRSQDNPVYYVQYAHARIAGIIRKAEEAGRTPRDASGVPAEPSERALVRRLLDLPREVETAAMRRAPHR